MSTVAPSGAGNQPAVEVRNGGTIVMGGNVAANSPINNTIELDSVSYDDSTKYNGKVVAQDGAGSIYTERVGISGAIAGSVTEGETLLGRNASATEWVVKGGNVTQTIGGQSNTVLTGAAGGVHGANPTRDGISEIEATRVYGDISVDPLAHPSSGINSYVTKSDGPAGAGGTKISYIDPAAGDGTSVANDSAGDPTRAVPGEFVYRDGGATPKQDDYKAKDSAES